MVEIVRVGALILITVGGKKGKERHAFSTCSEVTPTRYASRHKNDAACLRERDDTDRRQTTTETCRRQARAYRVVW
jgi:hypothetical protein